MCCSVWCSVVQCGAVRSMRRCTPTTVLCDSCCSSVLRCVVVCCGVLQCGAVCSGRRRIPTTALCGSCVEVVRCIVLHCVAARCSVVQCVAVRYSVQCETMYSYCSFVQFVCCSSALQCCAVWCSACCSMVQCVREWCNLTDLYHAAVWRSLSIPSLPPCLSQSGGEGTWTSNS